MLRRVPLVFLVLVAQLYTVLPAKAYTLQYVDTAGKIKIKWQKSTIKVYLSSSLSEPQPNIKFGSDIESVVRHALERWEKSANIKFDIRETDEQSVSSIESGGDGISLITVAPTTENLLMFTGEAIEMSGRTRIFYTKTGRITEADIILNPLQQFSTDGIYSTYDLESTITHEIGHLLGLEHSCMIGATMQPRQGKNGHYNLKAFSPRTLAVDDVMAVRSLYGFADELTTGGSITGKITDEKGMPVFGANVWAEEVNTGRLIASNITFTNGTFRLSGLDDGKYRVNVEALDGAITPLDFLSKRGAYSALLYSTVQTFPTKELGTVKIENGKTAFLNAQIENESPTINPTRVGFNGQISTLSVPVNAKGIYTIYIGGEGLNSKKISVDNLSFTSPFLRILPGSLFEHQYSSEISVVSFTIEVSSNIPQGEYSLKIKTDNGEIAYMVGALTVDEVENKGVQNQNSFLPQTKSKTEE